MRELILGDIPDDYDPSKHQVFGAWCFFNNQDKLLEYQDQILNSTLTKSQFSDTEQYVSTLLEANLAFLTQYLNDENNTNYPQMFWKTLINDWFISFTSSVLEKKSRLENILSSNVEYSVKLVDLEKKKIFDETLDYNIKIQTCNIYASYLFSEIIKTHNFPNLKVLETLNSKLLSGKNTLGYRDTLKQKVITSLVNKLRIQSIFGFNFLELILLSMLLSIKSFFAKSKETKETKETKEPVTINDDFNWNVLLIKNLPLDFCNIKKYKINDPIFTRGTYICSNFKSPGKQAIRIAKMKQHGVNLFSSQHGSSYGDIYCTARNSLVELCHDGFFTWGWENYGPYPERMHPLPSPSISKLKKENLNTKLKNGIVLTTTCFPPWNLCITSSYEVQFLPDYISKIECIISNLSTEVKKDFFFRPRMTHVIISFDILNFIQSKYPKTSLLKGNLDKKLAKLKLVIVDNPGSVLNKTIGSNIPTLICWNPKCWIMTDEFLVHLEKFKQLNIFFDDPIEMTKHLNKIYDDIPFWWNSKEIQEAIADFNHIYARTSAHPLKDWVKYIWQL